MGYYGLGPGTKVADQLSVLEQLLRKLPLATALEALELLEKITRNVVQNPTEEKFRQLKISNAKLAPVLSLPAAQDIMRDMGWEVDGERMVLPSAVKLDFQKHVGKIVDAKPYYKKALEEEKKAKKISSDPKKAEALRQLELDRREREADRSSKSNFPVPSAAQAATPVESPTADAAAARAGTAQAHAPAEEHVVSADASLPTASAPQGDGRSANQQSVEAAGDRDRSGENGSKQPFAAGDLAEVKILDGRHAGNWVSCQILGTGRSAGTYTIHVLPTTEFDNANGFANQDLHDIELDFLRHEGDGGPSRPGPCSFDSGCVVS